MMDEISILRETFDPDAAPSPAAQQRARVALQHRITPPRRAQRRWFPIAVGVATATAVAAALVTIKPNAAAPPSPGAGPASRLASVPYLRPVSAAQILENAAWSVEQEKWVDPRPDQFMYVDTLEMRNPPAYESKKPNGALVPGQAKYRDVQVWNRIDGQVQASMKNGKLAVHRQGDGGGQWGFVPWSQIVKLTSPEKVAYYLEHPEGGVMADPEALAGQYVLPPNVKAAIYRYLAQQPGMKVNPDAVNLDGHPAIGLGRVEEGYLSQELLFDKQTYALIGERLIAVTDHVNRGDDGTSYTHKGDLFRQVIYRKMIIVDRPGDLS
ncbi:CU044_5270 family protein [Actinoplanes sp. KI2]|uniref:CU044_5270 family protein n=1 Tax=Actinoplanes sp. KI2 TaxID=2983315 RepID=UPI0021D57039|nr:CU044_5270 family protein [Actinoplanes sp. KI2]MCU7724392.1 CU044_5270 family protein [Actinoplanes sp. KI2]